MALPGSQSRCRPLWAVFHAPAQPRAHPCPAKCVHQPPGRAGMERMQEKPGHPQCADGEPGEALRATGCVRTHSPGQEQEPGLNPALGPPSGDNSCTQASQGLWGGCVGLTGWTGHWVEGEP